MQLQIRATRKEWDIIAAAAQKNHKGRSVTRMISDILTKTIYSKPLCPEIVIEGEDKVRRNFDVPPHLEKQLICASRVMNVDPAVLVRMLLIDPILVENFLGAGSNDAD